MNSTTTATRTVHPSHVEERRDLPGFSVGGASSAAPAESAPVKYDARPISFGLRLGVQIYGFLGLSIFAVIVLGAMGLYFWQIVVKRRIQDMPEVLDRDEDLRRSVKNLPRRKVATIEAYTTRPERQRALERKKLRAAEEEGEEGKGLSEAAQRDRLHISWASSVGQMKDGQPVSSSASLGLKRRPSFLPEDPADMDALDKPIKGILRRFAGDDDESRGAFLAELPPAHTEPPRSETYIEPGTLAGPDMIGTTKASDCEAWATPRCTCGQDNGDALDVMEKGSMLRCPLHGSVKSV